MVKYSQTANSFSKTISLVLEQVVMIKLIETSTMKALYHLVYRHTLTIFPKFIGKMKCCDFLEIFQSQAS